MANFTNPTLAPRLAILLGACLIALALVLFWRPLAMTVFDPVFARSQGIPVGWVMAGLTAATALAAVAAFQRGTRLHHGAGLPHGALP